METIKEIDTTTNEGKYLFAALVILTQSKSVQVLGQEINGCQTEPDTMLKKVGELVEKMKADFKS